MDDVDVHHRQDAKAFTVFAEVGDGGDGGWVGWRGGNAVAIEHHSIRIILTDISIT